MKISLAAHKLSRSFDNFCALAPTSITIQEQEIVMISGQNGSGKSTLLQCLSGLLRPSGGKIEICGYDLYDDEVAAKKCLAFVPDIPVFYTELTAWEHLQFIAMAHNATDGFVDRAGDLLAELGLWEARNLFPHNYSRGMRLKLGLALALIRPLKLLIMDEPASALDPQSVEYLANKFNQLRSQGTSILFSSHQLNLADQLNARHWVMQQGELKVDM